MRYERGIQIIVNEVLRGIQITVDEVLMRYTDHNSQRGIKRYTDNNR